MDAERIRYLAYVVVVTGDYYTIDHHVSNFADQTLVRLIGQLMKILQAVVTEMAKRRLPGPSRT